LSGFGTTLSLLLYAVPPAALVALWLLWLAQPRVAAFLRKPNRLAIVAGVAAGAVILTGLPVVVTSFNLARERSAILDRLANASLRERDAATVELLEQGSVTVGDKVFRSAQLRQLGEQLFDKSTGKLAYAEQLAELFMAPSMPEWAPPTIFNTFGVVAVLLVGAAIAAGAVLLGLAPLLAAVLIAAVGGAAVALLAGKLGMLVAIVGMIVLITGYGVLSRLFLRALSGANPTSAVANIVLRESTRQWYTGAFILVLLVVLPLVPLAIDAGPLRYRIQSFLSWSLGVSFGLAGLLTLVLSCATVALEIRDRQIWQTLTKPIDRLRYIVGKWLGVVIVNAVLLVVSGISILLFVEYMRTQPAQNFMDETAVRDEVLVARLGAKPVYEEPTREEVRATVDGMIAADPTLRSELDQKIRDEATVRRALSEQVRRDAMAMQRQIPQGAAKSFEFTGLQRARELESNVTLSFLIHIGASDPHTQHPVIFKFKDGTWIDRQYVPAQRHREMIPWQYVESDGTLTIEIGNFGVRNDEFYPGVGTLNWDPDGIEVLFKVGGFEANFVRAIMLEWIKLAFLAMLGICCATVLNFPVALLFTATVYFIGLLSPFLAAAIDNYWVDPNDPLLVQIFQGVVRSIAVAAHFMLSGYGEVSGEALLVEGRLVSWRSVAKTFVIIGVMWTGVTAGIGWAIFRRKELAIYSGQGG